MQRGALPADAFEVLTRRDVILETPLAPALDYFAGARYAVRERARCDDAWEGDASAAWLDALRARLVADHGSDEWLGAFDAEGLAGAIVAARRGASAPAVAIAVPRKALAPAPAAYLAGVLSL